MFKKIISILFVLITAFVLTAACAVADDAREGMAVIEGKLISEGKFPEPIKVRPHASMDELEAYILSEIEKGTEEIDLRSYGVTVSGFGSFYHDMINRHPELFYIRSGMQFSYYEDQVLSIYPRYIFTGDEREQRVREFNSHVDEIVSYALGASTDLGKLMRVNDYFCVNYEYDTSYEIYRPDQLFSGKTGVCQAYMLGYAVVLNELGIANTYAQSDAMEHIWNMVYLDGEWYHVDVTWNDPLPDIVLGAGHNNFLRSDDGIAETDHYDWTSEAVADSTKYDAAFWIDLETPLPVMGSDIYYFSYKADNRVRSIYRWNEESGKTQTVHSFGITNGYYYGFMPLAVDDNFIYYGEANKLYCVGLNGGTPVVIHTIANENEGIWSAWREGGNIKLSVGEDIYETVVTVDLSDRNAELVILPENPEIDLGESVQLCLVQQNDTGSPINAVWCSSNESVAAVDSDGVVTGISYGTATVSAVSPSGVRALVVVNVFCSDHVEIIEEAVAPTCTETGLTEGRYCSVCGKVLAVQEVAAALGHDEVVDAAVAPTCTATGLTEGRHCSRCGVVFTAQESIDMLEHTEVTDNAVAPTCTETGLTEGRHCSVCNAVTVAQEVVDALGHTEVTDNAVAPTCTETGLTEGKHCSVCDAVITAQAVVDALGHTEVIDKAVAPTCTETGLTEGKHCCVCDAVITAQTVVDALGHTEVIDKAVAPTCTETGLTEGKHCSVCDAVITAQTVVDALGHTEVIDKAVAPTCTETGLTEGKHCSVCDAVITAQVVVDALGHTEVIDKAVAPTCTETGLTEGRHCCVCDAVITAQKVVDALGHTEVIDKAVAPTCTETGLTEGKHCSVCDAVITAQTVVDALGHDEAIIEGVPATHITVGLSDGAYCKRCGEVLAEQTEIPKAVVEAIVELPDSLEIIDEQAFEGGNFECVVIPEGCVAICAGAFAENTGLRFVEIPASVIRIDATAFEGCGADLIIIASAGSVAQSYAEAHDFACVLR